MMIKTCKVCENRFKTHSLFKLVCSEKCRATSKIKSQLKYKNSAKGLAAKQRWRKNPKQKEIHALHMKTKRGKESAAKRIKRLIETVPYYKAMQILRNSRQYKDIRNKLLTQFGLCACCHSEDNLTIDHIVPASLGGKHEIDNFQVLCRSCNAKKKQEVIRYEMPKMQ